MNKSYYAVIPADVRYNPNLPDGAKLLFGEITCLCNEKGYCWASNSYFAELYQKSADTISRWIACLKKEGFIDSEPNIEQGNARRIYLSAKMPIPIGKNAERVSAKMPIPIGKNAEHNIKYNIKLNNKNIGEAKNEFLPHPPQFKNSENQTTKDPLTPYLNTKNNDSYIAPVPPKIASQKSYKQWSEKELMADIKTNLEAGEIQGLTKDICRAFYDYWREPAASGRHRFNLEKTWSTSLRLQRWVRTNFEKNFTGQSQNEKETESNRKVLK